MKKPLIQNIKRLSKQALPKNNTTCIVSHTIYYFIIVITFTGKALSRLKITYSFLFFYYFLCPP